MKIRRIDLDGAGSPAALVMRIFELEPDLPIPVPLEQLCGQLDISSITELQTEGFEAALVTDDVKSAGAILVARDRARQRRRFSIAHELGHFLIPTHLPRPSEPFSCSAEHLRSLDVRDQDRRKRMEAEANRFAALLLMPPHRLRQELQAIRSPQVTDIVRLAQLFDVSKEAMARAYTEYSRAAVAVVIVKNGRLVRVYRSARHFPWIAAARGQPVPAGSLYHSAPKNPGGLSAIEECEPGEWLGGADCRKVASLTEQVLHQQNGFALLMLHAEIIDEDGEDHGDWRDRP